MNKLIESLYITNTGLLRNINEDSILIDNILINKESFDKEKFKNNINSDNGTFFIVADGMGGHGKGEIASGIVLKTFLSNINKNHNEQSILKIIEKAKKDLDDYLAIDKQCINFGTVIAGLYIEDTKAIIFNCGDSRVYKFDGMFCNQLSHDHSHVQEMVDNGIINNLDVNNQANKNIVTSAIIGNPQEQLPITYIKELNIKINDVFLICSDGVWEVMSIEEIEECLSKFNSIECLKQKVFNAGANDNFSVIIVKVTKGE
jgi:protein phosphatase